MKKEIDSYDENQKKRDLKTIEKFSKGTKVVAMNNEKQYKQGEIIGEPDWWFGLYFYVKFDDDSINKVKSSQITII